MAVVLRASDYCERSSSDDLFARQALSITSFARIASLTSWFYQGVLFSLLYVFPTCLRPQQLVVDVVTAVRNEHHSVSLSSFAVKSSLNLDAMLCANAVRTSLSANNSF